MASYPTSLPSFQSSDLDSIYPSLIETVFAQEDDEDENDDEQENDSDEQEKEEDLEDETGEETELSRKVQAETLGGQSEVKIELEFVTNSIDLDLIIDEIIEAFALTREQADLLLEIEAEDDDELEEKFEVEIETENEHSEVEVELRFIVNSTDRDVILDTIEEKTLLTVEQINSILELDMEDVLEEAEEEIEIEAEVEGGSAKVKVEVGDEDFEFEFELASTDVQDIRAEIVNMILLRTDLTIDQIGEFEIEFEDEQEASEIEVEEIEEEETEEETISDLGEKITICHIPPGNPRKAHTITISSAALETHLGHGDFVGSCDAKLDSQLPEREAKLAEKQAEREARLAEKQTEIEARFAEKETKALQRAEDLIQKLEQRLADLEQRLQTLLEKVESGEYYGNVPEIDPVINSYSISIDGVATSIFDESVTSDASGKIFIENLVTGSKVSKFRVTGGEIFVDDNIYDVVFGKARISSSGTSGEKDTMVLILQAMDIEGNENTIRLTVDFDSPLDGDFGTEPIELEITKNSRISGQWSLSASGQLSLLEV